MRYILEEILEMIQEVIGGSFVILLLGKFVLEGENHSMSSLIQAFAICLLGG